MIDAQKVAKTPEDAALMAFKAGLDMELDGKSRSYETLGKLVKQGKISMTELDRSVGKVLKLKFMLGLFENPYVDEAKALAESNTKQDRALALEAAEKSAVLLKNENVLPLNASKIQNIAVVGPMAASLHFGGYSYDDNDGVSVLDGIKNFGNGKFNVLYAEGCKISETPRPTKNAVSNTWEEDKILIDEAVATASKSDVIVLVVGENEAYAREALGSDRLGDRESLELPGHQNELIQALLKTGKPVIAVMTGGRPLSFNMIAEKVPGIFQAFYLGQEAGTAIANLLFGKTNPSGKLCISIPRSVGQLPCYYSQSPSQVWGYLG